MKTKALTEAKNVGVSASEASRDRKLHPWAGGYVSPKYLRCMGETRVWVGDAEVNLGLTTPVAEGTSVLALSEARRWMGMPEKWSFVLF